MTDKNKNLRTLKLVFGLLVGLVIVLVGCFVVPISDMRAFFPFIAFLAFASCLLGIVLIILTLKAGVRGKQRIFLLLTGACSAGLLIFSVLHNLFYAFAVIFGHIPVLKYLMEILHVVFFLIAIPVCPIGFLIGVMGSMVLFRKRQKSTIDKR